MATELQTILPSAEALNTPAPAPGLALLPLLEAIGTRSPASPALLAPGREPLCYADLVAQVQAVGARLRSFGYEPGDRIAVALPDSPELALMMVAAIACCAAVPVNPRATQGEIERMLLSVRARAVVVPAGEENAARAAAAAVDLPILELRPEVSGPAGRFQLESVALPELPGDDDPPGDDRADDLPAPGTGAALVVHTSGTTGFPKVVPLTQDNLLSMMLANCDVLGLTPLDPRDGLRVPRHGRRRRHHRHRRPRHAAPPLQHRPLSGPAGGTPPNPRPGVIGIGRRRPL
jgi:acyl-CoA synthetase (AMP-forming)/AMP-acid ligase II